MRSVAGRTSRSGRGTGRRSGTGRAGALGLGTAAALAVLVSSVAAGVSYGGHTATVLDTFGSAAGLRIAQVRMEGQRETSESAILAALGIGPDSSLLTLDAKSARTALLDLPWVEQASVRKALPGTVSIRIEEKQAAALWQHERSVAVIDRDGDVLADGLDARFIDLPLLVGAGANAHADDVLDLLAAYPSIAERTRALVFVGGRRWDVVLVNGVQLKLPADGAREALARLVELDLREGLFDRDIVSIDVRLPDRVAIRPSEDALARDDKGGSSNRRREARI
ncbi:cell division protein FtsQ/DivIB [Amorphus sp. 3PC139-8]|uniref:cell division protein FtsQ/DivIB n=1 Tax=Amorphus sp. 3PC139-8 TaxID=2735676 RepID=UPI00345DEF72